MNIVKSPAISQLKIIRFWWNLAHYSRYWTRWQSRDQNWNFYNSRWWPPPSWISFLLIDRLSDFSEILYKEADGMQTKARWQKLQILKSKMADGRHFKIVKSPHLSEKNRPILMKFGTLQQILNQITGTWPRIKIFNIQDDDGRHLEKSLFLAITQ